LAGLAPPSQGTHSKSGKDSAKSNPSKDQEYDVEKILDVQQNKEVLKYGFVPFTLLAE
jgi:hypothetical protein